MNELEHAIKERLVMEVSYDGGFRLVEPYVLFVDKEGCHLVRVFQVSGFSHHPESLPQWRSFKVEGLSDGQVLRTHFLPRWDRKQELEQIQAVRVLAAVDLEGSAY